MLSVQNNIENINEIKIKIQSHPCCFSLEENDIYFLVICPEGYFPNAIRACKHKNKLKALKRILKKLDQVWIDNSLFN
jgi:hypothetical protein